MLYKPELLTFKAMFSVGALTLHGYLGLYSHPEISPWRLQRNQWGLAWSPHFYSEWYLMGVKTWNVGRKHQSIFNHFSFSWTHETKEGVRRISPELASLYYHLACVESDLRATGHTSLWSSDTATSFWRHDPAKCWALWLKARKTHKHMLNSNHRTRPLVLKLTCAEVLVWISTRRFSILQDWFLSQ